MRTILAAAATVLFIVSGCLGQLSGNPDNWCREGFFTREAPDFAVSVIAGPKNSRKHFYSDDREECPGAENCKTTAYLVSGDKVVTNRSRGAFTCAWYAPAKGSPTVGWLRTSDLRPAAVSSRRDTSQWLGEWRYAENSINFTDNKLAGYLNVTGDAMWRGLGDNVHVGELDGRHMPENGMIEYSDGDDEFSCKAKLRLLGDFLVVADNQKCGGANVSFSGVYTRSGKNKRVR